MLVDQDPQRCGEAEDADRQQGHRRLPGPQQADGGAGRRRHEREELEADVGQVVEELGRSCVLPLDGLGHPSPYYRAGNEPPPRAPGPRVQTSMSSASPWPPPEQIAARPRPPPLRCSSWIIVASIRAPEAPIGWPSATAPPFTFTRSGSAPSISTELSATDENASLISTRST